MELYVLSPALRTLGMITAYSSLQHVRQFAGSGSFVLKAPFTEKLVDLLEDDNLLFWRDGEALRAVFVDTVICEEQDGREMIVASGYNLRALLGRRIVWQDLAFTGAVEDFARRLVDENAVRPTDAARTLPLLRLGARKGLTPTLTRQTEHENLEDLLDALTETHAVGFDVALDLDAKALDFVAWQGVDRTNAQRAVPRVILSRQRGNVVSQTYTRSAGSLRDTALIGGETDEETGVQDLEQIIGGSGLDRREVFVKASARSKPQDEETEEEAAARYRAELLEKGREKLAAQAYVESLDCEVDAAALEGVDLGDRITVVDHALGLEMHPHIAQIASWYTGGAATREIVLGEAVPTLYTKLEKELR